MTKARKRQLLWAAQVVALARIVPIDWLRLMAAHLVGQFLKAAKRGQSSASLMEASINSMGNNDTYSKVLSEKMYRNTTEAIAAGWERATARSSEAVRRLTVLDQVWDIGLLKTGGDAVGGYRQALATFEPTEGEPFVSSSPNLSNMATK